MKFEEASFDAGIFTVACPRCSKSIELTKDELNQINSDFGGIYQCPSEECHWTLTFPNSQEMVKLEAGETIKKESPQIIEPVETEAYGDPFEAFENETRPKKIVCPKCKKKHLKNFNICPSCGFYRKGGVKNTGKGPAKEGGPPKTPTEGLIMLALVMGVCVFSWQIPRWAGCAPNKNNEPEEASSSKASDLPLERKKQLDKIKSPFTDAPQ